MTVFAELFSDARSAVRSFARQRAVTLVALVTIALGTGATAAVLSVRHALLIRPLPVGSPHELYQIDEDRSGAVSQPLGIDAVPYERFQAYQRELMAEFTGLAGQSWLTSFAVAGDGGAVAATGTLVTGGYFDVLQLAPALGRFFLADDERAVVLGHGLWHRMFGGDPEVLGRSIRIDGRSFMVVGIAPPGFDGTMKGLPAEMWIPVAAYEIGEGEGFWTKWLLFFGRLRPELSPERAEAAVDALARSIPTLQPQSTVRGATLVPLTGFPEGARPQVARYLALLVGTGAVVLLIASANIAGVLLARVISRRREVAVRLALGAARGRVVRHFLTETMVLFVVGGSIGLVLGFLGTRMLQALQLPIGLDVSLDLSPEPQILVAALAFAAVLGGVFGLVPAIQGSRSDLVTALKSSARGRVTAARGWRAFVGAQLLLSVLLLVTAGLFGRSFLSALQLDIGFDPEGVVLAQVNLGPHDYDEEEGRAFYEQLLEQVRAVPGVQAAAIAHDVVLVNRYGRSRSNARPQEVDPADAPHISPAYSVVGDGYFEALGIELSAGRAPSESDLDRGSVAVINEALAERFWPRESGVGRLLRQDGRTHEVVGVTRTGKYQFVAEPPAPYIFRSFAHDYRAEMTLHVRSTLGPGEALAQVRRILGELDPDVALEAGNSLTELVGLTLFPQRFGAALVGIFGLIGAIFAGVGVYGIFSFDAAQRTHELGIRVALGGHPTQLLHQMVRKGVRLAAYAVLAGLVAAALATRVLEGLMIGITPLDPLTYLAAGATLVSVAALASFVPARRATAVDPIEALRSE